MNRPCFLKLLRSVSIARPQGKPRSNGASSGERQRRLRLEALESRRVLAASVTAFTPTDSGFIVQLSEEVNTANLNLYDTQSGAMGAADVTLRGATVGDIQGSLIVDGTTMTFVTSGGPLAADTYTVTLRSASNGFTDLADGELLDGEYNGTLPSGNGTAGGDFIIDFTVESSTGLVVGLPDFARGPTQIVQAPANGSGSELPGGLVVQLSDAAGVTSVMLTVQYDPALLDVTDVQLGADAPEGSQVEANLSVPGVATIAFFALDPLEAGQSNLIELMASVPESAPYGSAQVLRITSLDVNAGAIAARADDALHVVAFAGDVNANRRYDAEDARLIARVGVGLDTGFVSANPTSTTIATPLYPLIDPLLLGDVTGAGGISPLDSSDVLRKVVGLPVPNLPDLPNLQAPFGLSLSNSSVSDSQAVGATVGSFTTSDPNSGDTFTYALVSGSGDTDNDSFAINGNSLVTAAALSASQGSYSIRVRTTDSTGGAFERSFTISVSESNLAPTAVSLSASAFSENQVAGTTIATLATTDANASDTFTYTLVAGDGDADNAAFLVSGDQLQLNAPVDFESQSTYNFRVRSTDSGGLFIEQPLTLSVTDANDPPSAINLSSTDVSADVDSGALVGDFSTDDPDAGDTHTYTLVAGAGDIDNSLFSITGDALHTATVFDGDSQATYSIRVRSTDASGEFVEQIITGAITGGSTEENVAPTAISLSNNSFPESSTVGSSVGTLSTTDANASDTHSYSFATGEGDSDNAAFQIIGSELQTATPFDFETKSNYSVRIRSTDPLGLFFEDIFTLAVTDVNEAPVEISLSNSSVPENATVGSLVGELEATDPDAGDAHTFALVAGEGDADNGLFTIDGNALLTAEELDFESQETYSIRVQSTDSTGLSVQQAFVISVTNVNEAPTTLSISKSTIADLQSSGTIVGVLSTEDPDLADTFSYSLVVGDGDADNAAFEVVDDQLVLAANVDAALQDIYSIRLRSEDAGGLAVEQILEILVSEANVAPTAIALDNNTIEENSAVGSLVGILLTEDENELDDHIYSLVSGEGDADNAKFIIAGSQLLTAEEIDFESQSSFSIRVRSEDPYGLTVEQILTIAVLEVFE